VPEKSDKSEIIAFFTFLPARNTVVRRNLSLIAAYMSIVEVLYALCSADNLARRAAETRYEELKSSTTITLHLLEISSSNDKSVEYSIQKLAMVLLRRLICHEDAFDQLDGQGKEQLKARLLYSLLSDKDTYVKARICDVIGHLVGYELSLEDWPELLPFLFKCVTSEDHQLLENGLALIGFLSIRNIDFITNDQHLPIISQTLVSSLLNYNGNTRLPIAALRTLALILSSISQESTSSSLQIIIMASLKSLNSLINDYTAMKVEDTSVCAYIEIMIDIAEESSRFLVLEIATFVDTFLTHLSMHTLPTAIRNMLLEFLVVLTTNAPKYVRKLSGGRGEKGYVLHSLLPICLDLMSRLPEDANWHLRTGEEDDADDSFSDHDVGETSLDRLTKALGVKASSGLVAATIGSLLSQSAWQSQHNGLRVLGNYLELTVSLNKKELARHHAEVMGTLTHFAGHTHLRVRAAALYAVGQLCLMHGARLSAAHASTLLALLLSGTTDKVSPYPRLKLYVSYDALCTLVDCLTRCLQVFGALMNLLDNVDSSVLEPHVDSLLCAVMDNLLSSTATVQEYCILCLHSLMESVEKSIIASNYSRLVVALKQLLSRLFASGSDDLSGQTVEAICVLGEAAGRDLFYNDAVEMVGVLSQLQARSALSGSTDLELHVLRAWVRIARCLGTDCGPHLGFIVSKLLALITQDLSAEVADDDDDERY
jgi:hypothetical protein